MAIHHTTQSRPVVVGIVLRLASAALHHAWQGWQALERVYHQLENRRGIVAMLELDDHMLADMGVTRADVVRAANLPLNQSSGEALALVSTSRTPPVSPSGT